MESEFRFPDRTLVRHYANGCQASLVPSRVVTVTDELVSQLTQICNQAIIYQRLFNASLKGRPYTDLDAKRFLEWAQKGWQTSTHFVFFVLDQNSSLVAALDIKSANKKCAEIGYWADQNNPGFLSNALISLSYQAFETGFEMLIAFVDQDNQKSRRVLSRAGFRSCTQSQDSSDRDLFELKKTV